MKKLRNSVFGLVLIVVLTRCSVGQTLNKAICEPNSSINNLVSQLKSEFDSIQNNKGDKTKYFRIFPCSYKEFVDVFGFYETKDTLILSPLYNDAYEYIECFFQNQIDKNLFYNKVIRITSDSHWAADAVNYFQDFLMYYFKRDYEIILKELESCSEEDISDFWTFYLFGPHPEKKEKYVSEIHEILGNSHPKIKRLLDSSFESLLQKSREDEFNNDNEERDNN